MAERMTTLKVVGMLGLFTVLGIPLVAYLWETLNQALALHFNPARLGISVAALALFLGLLFRLKKSIQSKESRP